MASALHPSLTCINIEADYVATALNGGVLRIYDGTQPPSAENAITTQATIANFAVSSPAQIAGITSGTITFQLPSAVSSTTSATASWYRVYTSAMTAMWDGNVGTAGDSRDLTLNSVNISLGASVSITSWTRTFK